MAGRSRGASNDPQLGGVTRDSGERGVPLQVWSELLTLYQREIGVIPTLVWLNLALLSRSDGCEPVVQQVASLMGIEADEVEQAFAELVKWDLLAEHSGTFVLQEPLADRDFYFFKNTILPERIRAEAESAATVDEPSARPRFSEPPADREPEPVLPPAGPGSGAGEDDLNSVVNVYRNNIGELSPSHEERLREWLEEKGMEAALVAHAIVETAERADSPSIGYLEGILLNWFNNDIRCYSDLQEQGSSGRKKGHKRSWKKNKTAASQTATDYEGWPNAGAYKLVNPDMIKKWKEMYPDEYPD